MRIMNVPTIVLKKLSSNNHDDNTNIKSNSAKTNKNKSTNKTKKNNKRKTVIT